MRSPAEIVARIRELEADKSPFGEIFDFQRKDLIEFLDYDHAKEFLKPDYPEEEWLKISQKLTRENVLAEIADYIDFAWDKCLEHRQLSAVRSIEHLSAWVFLLGDPLPENLLGYGEFFLDEVCQRYGFNSHLEEYITRYGDRREDCPEEEPQEIEITIGTITNE